MEQREKKMSVMDQKTTDKYSIFCGDCIEVMRTLPDEAVDFSIYSPPFCGLYNYSSNERDLSNCKSYAEFFVHYGYVLDEVARLTKPGRITAVHCIDVPGTGNGETARMGNGANVGAGLIDFPGDIIRAHEARGFQYVGRRCIWKEPYGVRVRTMAKGLTHMQLCEDSTLADVASADYLLAFRKRGENKVPVHHPAGLTWYCGERIVPSEILKYRNWTGSQLENKYSQWVWRQYASSFWDDIRIDKVLPYKESKDPDDERHVHPLQQDVIQRGVILWSNPGEVVLTPFMGVGSECYGAMVNGRRAIGAELKPSYYKQAVRNLADVKVETHEDQIGLFEKMDAAEMTPEKEGLHIDEDRRKKMIKKSHQGC
jgi:DNA modification methylase